MAPQIPHLPLNSDFESLVHNFDCLAKQNATLLNFRSQCVLSPIARNCFIFFLFSRLSRIKCKQKKTFENRSYATHCLLSFHKCTFLNIIFQQQNKKFRGESIKFSFDSSKIKFSKNLIGT
jgi:hypothetical protein